MIRKMLYRCLLYRIANKSGFALRAAMLNGAEYKETWM